MIPLTPGAIQLADASGFAGIAFDARGSGRYALLLESYGIDVPDFFRAGFMPGRASGEVRIPFAAFRQATIAVVAAAVTYGIGSLVGVSV